MTKLLYLTNIPAPYRIKRFNDMMKIFPSFGIDFEVLFMAKTEPDREWIVDETTMNFRYRIWPGYHPMIKGVYAHFNPSLLLRLRKQDYDIIIIGGISTPTLIMAPFFIGKKPFKVISVETNLRGDTTKTGLKKWLKGKLLGKADGYQVTGELQKEYITFFSEDAKDKPFIKLPNLINGKKFHEGSLLSIDQKQTIKEKYGIPQDTLLCIIPARLVDIKYPDALLSAMPKIKGVHFVLVGSGPIEQKIKDVASKSAATMIPFQPEDEMVKLYGIADMFCLASITDASPLTAIEAICCGLPMLVSDRIGNIGDVLEEGKNGFSFSPYDESGIIKAFNKLVSLSDEERTDMRKHSYQMYQNTFENEKCLANYAQQIIDVINRRK